MSLKNPKPARAPEMPRPVGVDPVAVHEQEVDVDGPDLATLVHTNAKNICDALGVPCGCQANLPNGLCIASFTPCRFSREHAGKRGSGKAYAVDARQSKIPAGKPGGRK